MTGIEITSMFKATFSTPEGKKCLKHLEEVFVKRVGIAKPNMDMIEIGIRSGQRDLIMQIVTEVNKDVKI